MNMENQVSKTKRAKLIIDESLLDCIAQHGKRQYPHEACGIILGKVEENENEIVFISNEVKEAKNLSDNPIRFILDPLDFIRIQDEADKKNLEIIGIYHTHPDHPPIASQYDLEAAVDGLFYLIMSIINGQKGDFMGWFLDFEGSRKKFVQSQVIVKK
jgi:proteasome lid subunit RPN8/RPN11